MFDSIYVKTKLPLNEDLKNLNVKWEELEFQTKDLENCLLRYDINDDKIVEHVVEREYVHYTEEEKILLGNVLSFKIILDAKSKIFLCNDEDTLKFWRNAFRIFFEKKENLVQKYFDSIQEEIEEQRRDARHVEREKKRLSKDKFNGHI